MVEKWGLLIYLMARMINTIVNKERKLGVTNCIFEHLGRIKYRKLLRALLFWFPSVQFLGVYDLIENGLAWFNFFKLEL